jgi:hypothetical protein
MMPERGQNVVPRSGLGQGDLRLSLRTIGRPNKSPSARVRTRCVASWIAVRSSGRIIVSSSELRDATTRAQRSRIRSSRRRERVVIDRTLPSRHDQRRLLLAITSLKRVRYRKYRRGCYMISALPLILKGLDDAE